MQVLTSRTFFVTRRKSLSYFGAGTELVTAGVLVDSAAPGARLGGVFAVSISGKFDVPDSVPGVLDGAGAVGVVAAGGTAVDGC